MIPTAMMFARNFFNALPARLARLMLFGSFFLYGWLFWRTNILEQRYYALAAKDMELTQTDVAITKQNSIMVQRVEELTTEIRGYREDLRDELRLLRQQRSRPSRPTDSSH